MTDRLRTLTRLHSTSSRQLLLELMEGQETLLLRCADREIDTYVRPVLERLTKTPSLAHFGDEGAWPFAAPLEEAGFLDHFFWAKYEPNYHVYWSAAFEDVIRHNCRSVIGKAENWDALQLDLFEACCGIEEESVFIPSSLENWVQETLFRRVYNSLLNGDMDSVRDWGVRIKGDDFKVEMSFIENGS
jgi:hypothetical protein